MDAIASVILFRDRRVAKMTEMRNVLPVLDRFSENDTFTKTIIIISDAIEHSKIQNQRAVFARIGCYSFRDNFYE